MLSTKQPVLRRFWYPVMRADRLDDGRPHPFRLLGENIVLWRLSDGGAACVKDRCCHRTARLSLGFVQKDHIVCGYHGWEFNCAGACVRIPQRAEDAPPPPANYCVESYQVKERYGYLWVALADPLTGIPELPHADVAGYRQVHQFDEMWKIGAFRLMENSFDPAHVAYVHRNTFGDMSQPRVKVPQVESIGYGLRTFADASDEGRAVKVRGDVAQRAIQGDGAGETRRLDGGSYWFMPFIRYAVIRYPNGLEHILVTCATPISDQETQVIQWVYRNDTEADVSSQDVIEHDRAITLEDKAILESCEPDVPLEVRGDEEMLMASDRVPLVMRRMLLKLLTEHGELDQRATTGVA